MVDALWRFGGEAVRREDFDGPPTRLFTRRP